MGFVPKAEVVEHWEAPPGAAPWRPLSDEEFAELEAQLDPEGTGNLRRNYDHVPDDAAATKKMKGGRAAGGDS